MSYKPDKATLTSYLYGELSKEEHEKVEVYLAGHPDLKKELEEILSMQKLMAGIQDKEIEVPTFIIDEKPQVLVTKSRTIDGFIRRTLAVAASISILLVVGYFTSLSIVSSDAGIEISFGESMETEALTPVFDNEIKSWMISALENNTESLLDKIDKMEEELSVQSRQLTSISSSTEIRKVQLSEELLEQYVKQIKKENRDIILSLMEVSGVNQKRYMDEVMTDFANFMEEQRRNDLLLIEAHLKSLANAGLNQMDNLHNSD